MLLSLIQTRKLYVCVYISILRGSHGASLAVWWGSRWQLICVSTWPAKTSSLGLCEVSLDGRSTWLVGSAVSLPSVGLHPVHWRSEKKSWGQEECPFSPLGAELGSLCLSLALPLGLTSAAPGSHAFGHRLKHTPALQGLQLAGHGPSVSNPRADSSQPASRPGALPCSSEPWASTEEECRCAGEEGECRQGRWSQGRGRIPACSPPTQTYTHRSPAERLLQMKHIHACVYRRESLYNMWVTLRWFCTQCIMSDHIWIYCNILFKEMLPGTQ